MYNKRNNDKVNISNITTAGWEGNGNDGDIELYTDINKSGNFAIASFNVKEMKVGSGNISVNNISFSDSAFKETSISSKNYTINVITEVVKSSNNNLRSLSIDGVALSPNFNANTTNYTASTEKML